MEKSSFYIYENWTAEKKVVIHKANCSFCNNGFGIHKNKTDNRNGTWHGPYNSCSEAKKAASKIQNKESRELKKCKKCINLK